LASRWERLAVEAHCRHALNFAEQGGPYRRLKEDLVFDALEDQMATEVMEVAHAWHAAAAASDPWDTEGKTFEFHRKESNKLYRGIGKLKLPWYKRWTLDDADALVKLIQQFYAQEKEPGFKEWREKTKKDMRDKIEQAEEENRMLQEAGERFKQVKAEQEKRAKEAHERRQARTRRPVRLQGQSAQAR
jgi:hypothetical protein